MLALTLQTSATKILDDRKRRVAKRTNRPVQTEWEKSGMNISVLGTIRDAIKIRCAGAAKIGLTRQRRPDRRLHRLPDRPGVHDPLLVVCVATRRNLS